VPTLRAYGEPPLEAALQERKPSLPLRGKSGTALNRRPEVRENCAVEFPAKPHSHVVPAGYLRGWAAGKQIRAHRAATPRGLRIGVRDAGVRRDFYKRLRPDGSPIYDVEWSLEQGENTALPGLKRLVGGEWPPGEDLKALVGTLFAHQLLRGPRFSNWHGHFVRQTSDAARDGELPAAIAAASDKQVRPEVLAEQIHEQLSSDTERLSRMLSLARTATEILVSMHWSLLRFEKPCLVTSDEPVVVWPLIESRRPRANDIAAGLLDTLEVFVPLSPDLLLLATWSIEDELPNPVPGTGAQAATANAFVIANADDSWFSHPAHAPFKPARGVRRGLSLGTVPNYSVAYAIRSPLREALSIHVAKVVGRPLSNEPLEVVSVRRRGA
jgi:hypothetical protein